MSPDPYATAVPAPAFPLRSADFRDGGPLPLACYATGGDRSPELSWTDLPAGTRSLVVTAFDADAPIPGGLWHWVVTDVPADQGSLPAGAAGTGGGGLPAGARHQVNSLGVVGWSGVAPPPGTGTHRLHLCVTALDVAPLVLPPGASTALLNIVMIGHTLGRAVLVGTSTPPQ